MASSGNWEGSSAVINMSRRSMVRISVGLAASGTLARPYIANAQAKTAVVWQNQGFVRQEDEAFVKTVRDYEKASGNKIDLSVMPFMALGQKAVSALTTGDVPDLMFFDAPSYILPQNAWDDKLVDVSDVVEPYRSQMTESALLNSTFYNRATQKRSFYLVPIKQGATPFHFWGDLVEKAGLLKRIRASVALEEELSAITFMATRSEDAPALLFENLDGGATGTSVLANMLGASTPRYAIAMGLEENLSTRDMIAATRRIMRPAAQRNTTRNASRKV